MCVRYPSLVSATTDNNRLKDLATGSIVLPNENGIFLNLDAFTTFPVEIGSARPHRGKAPESQASDCSSSEDSDFDFQREVYWLAATSRKWKKKTGEGKKADKPHGKRPVPCFMSTSSASWPSTSFESPNEWFFKVTVGSWGNGKKIHPRRTV